MPDNQAIHTTDRIGLLQIENIMAVLGDHRRSTTSMSWDVTVPLADLGVHS